MRNMAIYPDGRRHAPFPDIVFSLGNADLPVGCLAVVVEVGDQDIALAHILPAKPNVQIAGQLPEGRARIAALVSEGTGNAVDEIFRRPALRTRGEIGRASCRERVWQYV